jgi:hypothetical protein
MINDLQWQRSLSQNQSTVVPTIVLFRQKPTGVADVPSEIEDPVEFIKSLLREQKDQYLCVDELKNGKLPEDDPDPGKFTSTFE